MRLENATTSGKTSEAAASPPSVEEHVDPGTETASPPVSPAPTRSVTNLAIQAPRGRLIGTPGAAVRRSAEVREASRSYSARTKPPPGVRRPARRRGDAAAMPANPSPPVQGPAAVAERVLPVTETVRTPLNPWPAVARVAGMIALTLLCVMIRPAARDAKGHATPGSVAASKSPASPEAGPLAGPLAGKESAPHLVPAGASAVLPAEPSAALTAALDHLSTAIDGAAEGSPEEILRKVSKPGQDCTMVWVDNSPSLVFGRFPIRENSLAQTLEACAQAVARLH